jgi:hypothetical protein
MPLPSKAVEDKVRTITAAWESLRSTKTFAGMTLEQFKTKVRPSLDARAALEDCEHKLTAAQNARDDADQVSNNTCLLVVNAVKGDPDEGEDGELYEAMGYVRKSERKSGLKRGKLRAA